MVGVSGGAVLGVLSSVVFEAMNDPTEEQDWLFLVFYLGVPLMVGVLSVLWARTRLAGKRFREAKVHALALTPVPGWMAGFAATHAVIGHSDARRGVGGAIIVGVLAAIVIPAILAVLKWVKPTRDLPRPPD